MKVYSVSEFSTKDCSNQSQYIYFQAYAKEIGSNVSEEQLPHLYAEGPFMTLADVILFPCFYILLSGFASDALDETVPLVSAWYARILASHHFQEGTEMLIRVRCTKLRDSLILSICIQHLHSVYFNHITPNM